MKYLERAYPWLLLAPVLLPVVIWNGFIYPYLVPKTLLFYALACLTLAAFALLASHGRAFFWPRLRRRETWIPAALLALAYGTSWVGIDFYRSFWSLFIRGDGLLMLTCAVTDFYLVLLYADRTFFERLLRAVAIVGSVVAIFGIGEWVVNGGRIGGLLGNAAFFAGYLGIAVFATLGTAAALPQVWRRAAYLGAVLQVVAIILSATRGTLLALIIAGCCALVFYALRGEGGARAWSTRALIALVVLGGIFFTFRSQLAQIPFEPVARIATISAADPDIASRLFIWKNMVGEIQKSPWLGVGAEHIDVLFNRFYDPTQISEQWFDRSHNAFLDYAAQYGLGGLILYLALIGSFIAAAKRLAERGEKRLAGIIALLALTYAVQNFFVFDTVSSFWLVLALLAAVLSVSLDSEREALQLPAWIVRASWPVAAALLLAIIPFSVRPALAAYDLAHGYLYMLVDVPTEVNYLSHGIALNTYGDIEYGYEAYDMYANYQTAALPSPARADAYQATAAILKTNFDRYPYDARTALYLAHMLSLAPPEVTVDKTLLANALARAIKGSPKRLQPWYILANFSIDEANTHPEGSAERTAGYAAAINLLSRYISLVPTLAEPHFILAQLLYASHDPAAAAAEAAKGKTYYVRDLETASRAASYYESVFDLPNAAFFLTEVVLLDSTNTAAADDLAKIQAYESKK